MIHHTTPHNSQLAISTTWSIPQSHFDISSMCSRMLIHTLAIQPPTFQWLREVPSIRFGLETNTLRSLRDMRRTPFRERVAGTLNATRAPTPYRALNQSAYRSTEVWHFLRSIALPACNWILLAETMIDTIVVMSDLTFFPLHDLVVRTVRASSAWTSLCPCLPFDKIVASHLHDV